MIFAAAFVKARRIFAGNGRAFTGAAAFVSIPAAASGAPSRSGQDRPTNGPQPFHAQA